MDCLVSGLLCPLLDYILCVSIPLIVQMYSLSYKDCYKWSLNFGLPVCRNNHNYLACQGFCHPLKWSQRLFDRKFYPDFQIRPNVPWQFFSRCPPQAHNVCPGTRNQSVYCYHYCLITTNLRPSHSCPPILVIQSDFSSLSSMRPLKMSLCQNPGEVECYPVPSS